MSWLPVGLQDGRARALVDAHYSRQTHGARQFLPPGRRLLLLTADAGAVWGVCENLDPLGARRWRVTVFRRVHGPVASELIRAATNLTVEHWVRRYGAIPDVPLTTEVDPRRVRRKRDPGRCFLRAGWQQVGLSRSHRHRGALVFAAPDVSINGQPMNPSGVGGKRRSLDLHGLAQTSTVSGAGPTNGCPQAGSRTSTGPISGLAPASASGKPDSK